MIKYGNSDIADVRLGSQQVAKVYHGDDLVWEKDDGFYVFPNSSAKLTSNNSLGFVCNQSQSNNYKDAWYCFDDDPGTAYCGVWDGSTMTHDVIIVFPFSVTVESITISQKEVGYSTQAGINAGKIYVNTAAKTKTSDSGWTEWCALSRGSGAAAGTDTVSTTHYPSASYSLTDPVRSIRVRGTSWGVNGTTKYGHIICGITIRYTADPTAVEAWKAQYGIN